MAINEQLLQLGYKPADLDYVFLSHIDGDHTGGLRLISEDKHIMPFDSVLNKEVDTLYYIGTGITEKIECERLYVKPKGKYIKYIHKGEYIPEKIYNKAKEYAAKQGLIIYGDVCESEIFPYIVSDKNNYMTEIYIPVK